MTTKKTQKPVPKAPAPRGRKKTHKKPEVPREIREAEVIAKQMYSSLTASGAPQASAMGYVAGASMTLKMLIDQAAQQGEDRQALKAQAMAFIQMI